MEDREDYKFLQIKDAVLSINQRVNLIGVVLEVGCLQQSKGSDCVCTLKIVDESYSEEGIAVNVFEDRMEKLPHIASVGDIILLCHVMMKTYNKKANATFNKRFSSFSLYEGRDGRNFLPYQVSMRFRSREQDKKLIAGLRKWLYNFQVKEDPKSFSHLRDIKEGEHVNLACKILNICEVKNGERMALVWDGTDTKPVSIHHKLEDERDHALPLQLEPFPLSRDLLCSFPAVGSILRVIIDQDVEKHILHLLHTGKWVKFINVLCQVNSGLWCGVFSQSTRLRYMPNEDCLILERKRSYDKRLSCNNPRMPFWCFPWPSRITEVDCDEDVPFVTLMDVLTNSEATAKFKCAVRVVAALPWQAEDFRSPFGNYRIRLTLEDPTARIHAFVYAEDGEKLFDGYPSIDVLKRKINKLLGVVVSDDGNEMDTPRNPAWVQCCLKSYYLDKRDIWGSRRYRIFGTKISGLC